MFMDKKQKHSLFIECDCGCVGLKLDKFWEDEPENDEMYMTFWIAKFYANQDTSWDRLKVKMKLLWRVLKGGDYFLQELVVTRKNVEKMKDYLNQF